MKLHYDKAISAFQMNDSTGEWTRTTVGVRQGHHFSPILFNIFLESIMPNALEEHDGKGCIGDRTITILPRTMTLLLRKMEIELVLNNGYCSLIGNLLLNFMNDPINATIGYSGWMEDSITITSTPRKGVLDCRP